MNKEIAEKWIARLTAEDAPKQKKGSLGTTDGSRCCLGVLCDIAVEEGVIPKPATPDTVILCYGEEITALPRRVKLWAGMRTNNGGYYHYGKIGGGTRALSCDNDGGTSFKDIAVTIAQHVDKL